jgi:hypothetical protein
MSDKLCAIPVNEFCVTRLGRVGVVVRKGDAKHTGPFFQFLAKVGIVESGINGSVPAVAMRGQDGAGRALEEITHSIIFG